MSASQALDDAAEHFILRMIYAERSAKERPGQVSVWALVGPELWKAVAARYGQLVQAGPAGRTEFCGIRLEVTGENQHYQIVIRDVSTGRCQVFSR